MEFYQFLCVLFCLSGQLLLNLPFSTAQLCRPVQSDALLQFNDSLTAETDTDSNCDPKMITWKNGLDCCSWDGVTCDNVMGNIINLDLSYSCLQGTLRSNSSLFALRHLQSLNLAFNNFSSSPILPELSVFAELRHLNLSHSSFLGLVPIEISFLSKLVLLDLSYNYKTYGNFEVLKIENTAFKILTQNLTELMELNLDFIDMSAVSLSSFVNLSSSLTFFSACSCILQGKLPPNIFSLPNLLDLNLEYNDLTSLESLTLSYTSISSKIPDSIGEFKNLKTLDLSNCTLTGSIPSWLLNLTKLTTLDLSCNELTGHIPSFVVKLEQLMDLKTLGLPSCNLTEFPPFLNSLKMLRELDLSKNKIGGQIPRWFWDVGKGTLQYLDISSNLIEGGIQQFPWKELIHVDLSHNLFQGPLPILPLHIVYFRATDNGFNGEIPSSVCKLSSLEYLKFARNNLSGSIPQGGQWPEEYFLHRLNRWMIDLSNNRFEGPLPIPPPTALFYFIANNKIGGNVSPLICNATELRVLDLSNNSLMGTLPECLMSFSKNLSVLNLRMNMIHGVIPRKFAKNNKLRTIDLSWNQFEGTLPRSLLHCENLEVLDVGNNRMKDTFPDWLGTLPKLQVLVLRFNMFHGFVSSPREARSVSKLRIFDLSNNNLSGPLPVSYIMKLTTMMYQDKRQGKPQYMGDANYQDSVMVSMKGLEIRLVKILTVFTSIDLSSNHFGGELPVYIGNLKSLKGLNFSHNNLTGYIPLSIGNLTELEWLDLSSNKFIGSIPQELADLTSLAFLNLSENQLIEPIPQGRQFNTFKSDSFAMNPRLCGFPLPETCTNNPQEIPLVTILQENDIGHGSWFEWRAILMGYGCGTVGGVSLGYIVLGSKKFEWLAGDNMETIRKARHDSLLV
ncbi:hypothetical protein EUGRSUZ_F00285 [Eucalyptus grandis]|uniref:Uncharacterized protein n=2 Tax=Eucalyptus grandis TaxID=71139 RepID=A0ACC3KBW9_EUCGR|nr:hypothetical protein EUGRSUZ_F00285 [Eucalyptus grandis]